MADGVARREEFCQALEAFMAEWPDVVSPQGSIDYMQVVNPDSISSEDIDDAKDPSYIAAWVLLVEHAPLDPKHNQKGTQSQNIYPLKQSPVHTIGLLWEGMH